MIVEDEDRVELITAIENDDVKTVARIFAEKFDKKFLQPVGILRVTAVHLVAWQGTIELLNLFHKNGADINASDKIGRCALFHAAHRGNIEVVNWLLERGAFTESKVGVDSCSRDFSNSFLSPCVIGRNVGTEDK